jgi:hypothetical protein
MTLANQFPLLAQQQLHNHPSAITKNKKQKQDHNSLFMQQLNSIADPSQFQFDSSAQCPSSFAHNKEAALADYANQQIQQLIQQQNLLQQQLQQ